MHAIAPRHLGHRTSREGDPEEVHLPWVALVAMEVDDPALPIDHLGARVVDVPLTAGQLRAQRAVRVAHGQVLKARRFRPAAHGADAARGSA